MPTKRKPATIEVGKQYRLQWLGSPCEIVIHVLRIEQLEDCRHVYIEQLLPAQRSMLSSFYSYTELYRRIWAEETMVMQ